MPAVREQLLASSHWSIRRPKFPLSSGHFVIRLNDPSIAFSEESAADLLRCYGHLRRALADVAGATAAQLHLALNWQPVGDAVGEPLAETSTPTVHTFFSFPGSAAVSSVLRLSAHERVAVEDNEDLDAQLRSWHGGKVAAGHTAGQAPSRARPGDSVQGDSVPGDPAPGQDRSWEPEVWPARPFHVEPVGPKPGQPFPSAQWLAVPRFPAATLDRMEPALLLELANTMEGLASHSHPPFQGITLWVTDDWDSPAPAAINIFARRHGWAPHQLANFVDGGGLDLPRAGDRQGNSGGASPTVEK